MSFSRLIAVPAALLLVLGLPLAAGAKEESKIQVPLVDDSSPGNGNGKGRHDGKLHSTFTEKQATFHVQVKDLVPGGIYQLRARDLELTDPLAGELIQEFVAEPNGKVNLKIDLLQSGDPTSPPSDPRGKLISIYDVAQAQDVMASWFYGDVANDEPHTKVKEQTELDPSDPASEGSASARYDLRPNGKASLTLQLNKVAPGSYDIHVDSDPVAIETLVPNSGGNAKLSLRTHPGKGKANGKSKGHNKKGTLTIDPRRKLIEVKQGGAVVFSGPMLAQIPGINVCTPSAPSPYELNVLAGPGTATSALATQDDCNVSFTVTLSGVLEDDYALTITDSSANVLATATISAVDVAGTVTGEVVFDTDPDTGAGEQLLDFDPSGQTLQIERTSDVTLIVDEVLP